MGLFEDLGKKVEQFKQQAESASQEQANRKCAECETLIYTDREDCPDCGGERILVRKGWQPEDDEDPDASDATQNTDASEGTESAGAPGEDGSDETDRVSGDDDRAE